MLREITRPDKMSAPHIRHLHRCDGRETLMRPSEIREMAGPRPPQFSPINPMLSSVSST